MRAGLGAAGARPPGLMRYITVALLALLALVHAELWFARAACRA